MNFAAVLAVAHSPCAGGLSQFADVGAMSIIWDSVRESRAIRGNENEIGVAPVRRRRKRVPSRVARVGCILVKSPRVG